VACEEAKGRSLEMRVARVDSCSARSVQAAWLREVRSAWWDSAAERAVRREVSSVARGDWALLGGGGGCGCCWVDGAAASEPNI
jgi:hypothetical protein